MSVPMKDSGVEWLGKVPAHWKVIQSRRLFAERNEKAKDGDTQLTVSQKYGLLPQTEFMEREGRRVVVVQKGQEILKRAYAGDFVISMRSFQGGLEYSEHQGSVSSAYVPLVPIKMVVPGYFRWLFKSSAYIQALQSTSDLVRDGQALRFENFTKVLLPLVPETDQAVIASHLDRATTRIDTLIAKKTRFIELLREKRQALITHAVTKGLDPNVPMKDSGVEWLGKVPAHWKAVMLRRAVSSFQQGWSPDCDGRPAEVDEWGVTKSGCVNGGVFREKENKALPARFEPRPSLEILDGDVLMSRASGSPSLIGSAAYVSNPRRGLIISDKIFRLLPTTQTDPKFLVYSLGSSPLRRQIEQAIGGAEGLANNLSQQSIKELWMAQPPLNEQMEIVTHLDRATSRIDTLIAKTERSIELLREHRTALITAAVTGKIDLRPAA